MPRVSPSEVKAIVPLLEQDWETPEVLAEEIIKTLDETRADKVTYAGVLQIGKSSPLYQGVGYFPGFASAKAAIEKHPAIGMASAAAVVSVLSPKGFTLMLDRLDEPPAGGGDWALIREDAALYKLGWKGDQKSRRDFLKRLNAA